MQLYKFPTLPEGRTEFCETPAATDMLRVIGLARKVKCIGAIIGAPGVGKTTTLQHYRAANADARYCVMGATHSSMSAVLAHACKALGVAPARSCAEMHEIICNALRWGHVAVLLVDEAQHLTDRSLDALRCIHDESGVPIVFAGNHSLRSRFNDDAESAFAQLTSRIGARRDLKGTSAADVAALAGHAGVGETKAVTWLQKRCTGSAGLRMAARLLAAGREIAGDGDIRLAHLRDAAIVLGGSGAEA